MFGRSRPRFLRGCGGGFISGSVFGLGLAVFAGCVWRSLCSVGKGWVRLLGVFFEKVSLWIKSC